MATTKFYLTSDKPNSSVYVRFSAGRNVECRRKTGISIPNPKEDWSVPKGLPKANSAENKNLAAKLKKLSEYILNQYNDDYNNDKGTGKEINGTWLGKCIDNYFNRSEVNDSEYFSVYASQYVVDMPNKTYTIKNIKKNFKPITIEKYQNIVNHFVEFEKTKNIKYKIGDITNSVTQEFCNYLSEDKGLSVNTIGRDIKRLKTILLDAEKNGIRISHKVKEIKGFEDEKIVVSLSFAEIEKIKNTEFKDEKLRRAKDWLIIACFTGQRISDLWRMKENMISTDGVYKYISLTQFKTSKRVKIPMHYEVEEVLANYKNNFPPMFSENEKSNRTQLGGLMKKVCEDAGINELIEARYNGKKGFYEKYKLISNHSCRRSFASNFYGNPLFTTPMLMEITGHVKEDNFLKYIGEEENRFSAQSARAFEVMRQQMELRKQEKEKVDLKIV